MKLKINLNRRHILAGLSLMPALVGGYILLLLPAVVYSPPTTVALEEEPLLQEQATLVNRLIIPKIELEIPYLTGGAKVLNENAWHRYPDRGDPVKGGNFILSGHRFNLGLTPGATKRKSPLYHINRLEAGDKIFVDFEGKRYEYEVVRRFSVKPYQTEIEAPSEQPKLTLYTCTFKGERDGREVVEAKPLGEVPI